MKKKDSAQKKEEFTHFSSPMKMEKDSKKSELAVPRGYKQVESEFYRSNFQYGNYSENVN